MQLIAGMNLQVSYKCCRQAKITDFFPQSVTLYAYCVSVNSMFFCIMCKKQNIWLITTLVKKYFVGFLEMHAIRVPLYLE